MSHASVSSGAISCLRVYLVFRPKQAEILAVDAVANEVHPVVFNTKIQVSEPEDEPKNRVRHDKTRQDLITF